MRNNRVMLSTLCLLPLVTACGSGEEGNGNTGSDSFAGQTYLLRIGYGDWGPGIGQNLQDGAAPEFGIKVDGSPDAYAVTIGTGYTPDGGVWAQETCNPTSHLTAGASPYPGFALGPANLPIYFRHPVQDASARATAYQFTLNNVLAPEGVVDGNGTLSAILDAREIYPVFPQLGPTATADDLCRHVASMNIDTCEACPHAPDQVYCLTLTAGYLEAPASPITLQETPGYADTCFFD